MNRPKPLIIEGKRSEEFKNRGAKKTGVIFPKNNTIVYSYGPHQWPLLDHIDILDKERKERKHKKLSQKSKEKLSNTEYSYLVFKEEEDNKKVYLTEEEKDKAMEVFIRPPPKMRDINVVLESDEILQSDGRPKHKISFLGASNYKLRKALMRRGECWRLVCPPRTEDEIEKLFMESKRRVSTKTNYWYNKETGTKYLSYEEFSKLESANDSELLTCLEEIINDIHNNNAQGNPETSFFIIDPKKFDIDKLIAEKPTSPKELYDKMKKLLEELTPEQFRRDNPTNLEWKNAMLAAITKPKDIDGFENSVNEENLMGLSPEYFMKIRWLPGAQIQEGIHIIDPIYSLIKDKTPDGDLESICKSHGDIVASIIENKMMASTKIESINVGYVVSSLSEREKERIKNNLTSAKEKRGVYIVITEEKGQEKPTEKVIRLQKRDITTFLEEGLTEEQARTKSEQYTDYILKRNLACRFMDMDVPTITLGWIKEEKNGKYQLHPYFERDYIPGTATTGIAKERFMDRKSKKFTEDLFNKLGNAAARNLVVGRVDEGGKVLFDDGDEILQEDKIVISDMTGSFRDYQSPLEKFIPCYAKPIVKRRNLLRFKKQAIDNYVNGFYEGLLSLQGKYGYHKKELDSYDFKSDKSACEEYNLQLKWQPILQRLASANPEQLKEKLRSEIYRQLKEKKVA